MPASLDTAAAWAWRLLVVGAVLAIAGWVALRLAIVTVPVLAATLFTAALWPLVDRLRRRGWSDTAAGTAAFLCLVSVFLIVVVAIVPAVVSEGGDLEDSVRQGAGDLPGALGGFGITREDAEKAVDGAIDALHDNARGIGSGVFEAVLLAANLAAAAVLSLVLAFFFLKDGPHLWRSLLRLVPGQYREDVHASGVAAFSSLSGYVRGQAVVALIDAVGIGLALVIVGVPLVLPVATLTFVLAFVPVLGAIVSGAVAALVALAFGGVTDMLVVLGAVVLVQQLEGNVLFPVIVGRSVSVHPVAVLLALATGAAIAGILGALIAIPLVAAATGAITERLSRLSAPEPPTA